jgi:hypothetical protein
MSKASLTTTVYSTTTCALVLGRAGFRTVESSEGFLILERDGSYVLIPELSRLEPEIIKVVLTAARMSAAEFEAILHTEVEPHVWARAESGGTSSLELDRYGSAACIAVPRGQAADADGEVAAMSFHDVADHREREA